jgi:hypothetical protein
MQLVDHCGGVTPIEGFDDERNSASLLFYLDATEDIEGSCYDDKAWCLMEEDRCELEVAFILALEGGGEARVDWTTQATVLVAGDGLNPSRYPEALEVTVSVD